MVLLTFSKAKAMIGTYTVTVHGQTFLMADGFLVRWPLICVAPVYIPITAPYQKHPEDYYLQAAREGQRSLHSVNYHVLRQFGLIPPIR